MSSTGFYWKTSLNGTILRCSLNQWKWSVSHSVVSDSLGPHGPHQAPLSVGFSRQEYKGSHSLLQGIFPTQRQNLGPLHCRQIILPFESPGKPSNYTKNLWPLRIMNNLKSSSLILCHYFSLFWVSWSPAFSSTLCSRQASLMRSYLVAFPMIACVLKAFFHWQEDSFYHWATREAEDVDIHLLICARVDGISRIITLVVSD